MAENAEEKGRQVAEKGSHGVARADENSASKLPGGWTQLTGSQTKKIGTIQPPPDIKAIVVSLHEDVACMSSSFLFPWTKKAR